MSDAPIQILLVDDEPRNLDAIEAILDDAGYRLLRAETADRALKHLLEHDVAAIVLDIKMPGVSGFELARMIKATRRFRQIPIVFLTAYLVDDADMIAGYGAGGVDYLTKPVNPQILRHKIAVFADLFRKTRALAELNEKLEERVRERTAELERTQAAVMAASRQKDEFIAVLAHELRNPLAPLRMGIDILMQHAASDAPEIVANTLPRMNHQLDHMVRLIDDLMDIARISSGAIELKREDADLATIIQSAIDGAQPFMMRRRDTVSADIAESVFVHGDAIRIGQILGNLLHNAVKFTPDHGTIRIELARDGHDAVIRVIDNGEGIPSDQLDRVFDMFARIDRPASMGERGLGIGLALARRIAELHGGSLVASSEGEGRGTTFTLRMPAVEPRPGIDDVNGPAPSLAMAVLNIVIIEDNADIVEVLSVWLQDAGHRVWVARNGRSGLDLVAAHKPDLVLCDLGLPQMDGIEVCRRVRGLAIERQPMMVALTGWGSDDDRRRTKEAGFDEHLVKPIATDKLRLVLRSVSS